MINVRQQWQCFSLLNHFFYLVLHKENYTFFARNHFFLSIFEILSLNNEADIVVPRRTDVSFKTYPDYQVRSEQKANRLWNDILRARGLLAKDSEDLDVWFGPKFFRNNPELVKLFLNKYEFIKGKTKLHKIVRPELWPNAIFLPVVAALHRGFRVKSVDVPYVHPSQQTAIEVDSPEFVRRRDVQRKNIIISTIHFIRLLEADPRKKSRLVPK